MGSDFTIGALRDHRSSGRGRAAVALKDSSWRFDAVYASRGRPSIRAGQASARAALAGAIHGAQRAAFDGAARLQPSAVRYSFAITAQKILAVRIDRLLPAEKI